MKYIKALFFSFLVIFFANYILPGIEVTNKTKLPHLGTDFPFAFALAFFNAFIYPAVQLFGRKSPVFQIITIATILNFAAYGSLSLMNLGIHVDSIKAYLLVTLVITIASIIANILEMIENKPQDPIEPIDPSNEESL